MSEGAAAAPHNEDALPVALGRRPTKHDPQGRTLQLARYLTAQLPAPPAWINWAQRVEGGWPVYANDRYGDCTCASAAHAEVAWSAVAGHPSRPSTDEVLRAYSAVTGFSPGPPPSNDNGAYMLDVANYWRKVGIGGRRVAAYMKIDHQDPQQIRQAIALFGAVYAGVDLPLAARVQFAAGRWWTTTATTASAARGSWGGHAVALLGYDARALLGITWGREQRMTWAWWRRYASEAYALVSPDFLDRAGRSPAGLDLAALLADLQRVTGAGTAEPPAGAPSG
jgi:hypothetical protein